MNYEVAVIGGGASGCLAAGRAAERGAHVVLLERMESLGRKLRITGKGRCNITNNGGIPEFIESYGSNGKFLYRAFHEYFNDDVREFFGRYGVETKIERGGRVFPVSDDAASVVNALTAYLKQQKVTVRLHERVKQLILENDLGGGRRITGVMLSDGKILPVPQVIIATGGLSYPGTGSTGDGYRLAEEAGHTIIPLRPALVPLETRETFVKELQGLGLKNVQVTAYGDEKKIASEFGEMLFTHFGISGPVILTMSGSIVDHLLKDQKVYVSINLKPAIDAATLTRRLIREFDTAGLKAIHNILRNLLPASLVPVILSLSGIPPDKKGHQITRADRDLLFRLLTDFRMEITRARTVDEAIITRGGVTLGEINPQTMESKKVQGLYFCGEVIDIDGVTGGYNLQEAFSTGYLAGNSVTVPKRSSL